MRAGSRNERPTGITGRFVLLPKHLVTGAAEASIVSPTRRASDGFVPLWKVARYL
jgi:hypothetical protein